MPRPRSKPRKSLTVQERENARFGMFFRIEAVRAMQRYEALKAWKALSACLGTLE